MTDNERLALAETALADTAGAQGLEAVVFDRDLALTRFSRGAIHQNVTESSVAVQIRALVAGGRVGIASTNVHDEVALRKTRERAVDQARMSPAPTIPLSFGGPAAYVPPEAAFDPATAQTPAEVRARAVGTAFDAARAAGAWAAGYVSTGREAFALANTEGRRAVFSSTDAEINVKCIAPEASGYAEAYDRRVSALDVAAVAERAARKATDAGSPQACDVGDWTVILEPPAMGELLHYLLPHFSAQRVDEGASFLADGLGKQYVSENVTLVDDYRHPLHAGRPFDTEGTPRERVVLIDGGVGRSFVTDREWAARLGRPNTGHFAPEVIWVDGPQPQYTVLLPGERSREELIANTKRGILISRFWYIRVVDQRRTIVTGMTRDGTFLIENGRLTHGLRNLRFNVSLLSLLGACELANEPVRTGGYSYEMVVPAGRFERFTFSSVTTF